jgi:hypothetical protein
MGPAADVTHLFLKHADPGPSGSRVAEASMRFAWLVVHSPTSLSYTRQTLLVSR